MDYLYLQIIYKHICKQGMFVQNHDSGYHALRSKGEG